MCTRPWPCTWVLGTILSIIYYEVKNVPGYKGLTVYIVQFLANLAGPEWVSSRFLTGSLSSASLSIVCIHIFHVPVAPRLCSLPNPPYFKLDPFTSNLLHLIQTPVTSNTHHFKLDPLTSNPFHFKHVPLSSNSPHFFQTTLLETG